MIRLTVHTLKAKLQCVTQAVVNQSDRLGSAHALQNYTLHLCRAGDDRYRRLERGERQVQPDGRQPGEEAAVRGQRPPVPYQTR